MFDESVCTANVAKLGETDLGDDSSKFSRSSGDSVCGRTVTSGEGLTRNNEGGGVGAEVLEEVCEAIEEDESLGSTGAGGKLIVGETHDDEGASENDETHHLDRFSSPRVDENEGNPVSGNEASNGKNQVSDGDVHQVVIDLMRSSATRSAETDGGQDDGRVEPKAVESDLNGA